MRSLVTVVVGRYYSVEFDFAHALTGCDRVVDTNASLLKVDQTRSMIDDGEAVAHRMAIHAPSGRQRRLSGVVAS